MRSMAESWLKSCLRMSPSGLGMALSRSKRGGGVDAGYGDAEGYGYEVCCFQDDAGIGAGLVPAFAGAVDVPAAGHEHVGDEDLLVREMDEEPLASCFDCW